MSVRKLICAATGKEFDYTGRGRPPLYCPEAKADRLKEQRRAASAKARSKRKGAKA